MISSAAGQYNLTKMKYDIALTNAGDATFYVERHLALYGPSNKRVDATCGLSSTCIRYNNNNT